jgi:hypothetical protein
MKACFSVCRIEVSSGVLERRSASNDLPFGNSIGITQNWSSSKLKYDSTAGARPMELSSRKTSYSRSAKFLLRQYCCLTMLFGRSTSLPLAHDQQPARLSIHGRGGGGVPSPPCCCAQRLLSEKAGRISSATPIRISRLRGVNCQ